MNIKTALDRARGLKPTQHAAAADLYSDVDYELAFGNVEEDDYERAEDALAYLREHFPDVESKSRDRVANGRTPKLSTGARRHVFSQDGEQPENEGKSTAVATRAKTVPARARQHVATRRARYQSSRRPRYAPTVRKVAYQVDDASGGWGSVVAMLLVGGVLLSILLLALDKSAGIAKLESGVTNVIGWILNPAIDPLRPPSTTPAPTANAYGRPTPAGGFRP
jgi:hypothetical protein